MYSRQNDPKRTQGAWQIPRNYSGNAFSPNMPPTPEEAQEEPINEQEEPAETAYSPLSAPSYNKNDKKSGIFGLSRNGGGIGFEELLILGLVLLISGSDEGEGNNDLAFLLLLLLFIQ